MPGQLALSQMGFLKSDFQTFETQMLVYSSDLCDSLCYINHPLDAAQVVNHYDKTQHTVYCNSPSPPSLLYTAPQQSSLAWPGFTASLKARGGGVAQPRLVEAEEEGRVEAGKEKAVIEKERLGMEGREGLMWGSGLEKNKNNTVVLQLKSFCFTV